MQSVVWKQIVWTCSRTHPLAHFDAPESVWSRFHSNIGPSLTNDDDTTVFSRALCWANGRLAQAFYVEILLLEWIIPISREHVWMQVATHSQKNVIASVIFTVVGVPTPDSWQSRLLLHSPFRDVWRHVITGNKWTVRGCFSCLFTGCIQTLDCHKFSNNAYI